MTFLIHVIKGIVKDFKTLNAFRTKQNESEKLLNNMKLKMYNYTVCSIAQNVTKPIKKRIVAV